MQEVVRSVPSDPRAAVQVSNSNGYQRIHYCCDKLLTSTCVSHPNLYGDPGEGGSGYLRQ